MSLRDRSRVDAVRAELVDIPRLIRDLGLEAGSIREGRGRKVLATWRGEKSPSVSVTIGPDRTIRFFDFGASEGGDVLALIARVDGLDERRDFVRVIERAEEIAGISFTESPPTPRRTPVPSSTSSSSSDRTYPDPADVAALWDRCRLAGDDERVAVYLAGRALDVVSVEDRDLARALPASGSLPRWARCAGRDWRETSHLLVLPLFDELGALRSLRAMRVSPSSETPKRLAPAGHRADGLVLADAGARCVLAGAVDDLPDPVRVVVAEGEADFLTWATRWSDAAEDAPIVFGVSSGAWADAIAGRIPSSAQVVIRTHGDDAGDRYASSIVASLSSRVARIARARSSNVSA